MPARKRGRTSSRYSPYGKKKSFSKRRRVMTAPRVRAIVRSQVERSESKFIAISQPLGSVSTTYSHNSDTNASLVKIPTGSTSGSRVGVKCRVDKIHLKMRMFMRAPTTGQNQSMTVRIRMDEVKQGVLEATSGVSAKAYFDRPDYVNITKRAIFDKTFILRPAGDGDMVGNFITFNKMFRFRKPHWCRFKSLAEPETGNIILAAFAEAPDGNLGVSCTIDSEARTYFSEV